MTTPHIVNIAIHVTAGSLALIAGLVASFTNKGGKWHVRFGRYFSRLIIVVILTGLIGIFVFHRNNFLLVITLLAGYNCFSGIRAIKLNGRGPKPIDIVVSLIVMASAVYYMYYIRALGLYWSPIIIYSTVGALFMVTVYDLLKLVLPFTTRKKAVMYEHSYKMISALSGIASAFIGTVFPQYKPYSQFMPSAVGIGCIALVFVLLSIKSSGLYWGKLTTQND